MLCALRFKKTESLSVKKGKGIQIYTAGKHLNRILIMERYYACKSVPCEYQLLCLMILFTTEIMEERYLHSTYCGRGWAIRAIPTFCVIVYIKAST